MIVVVIIVITALVTFNETRHIFWFATSILFLICVRLALVYFFNKDKVREDYLRFANYYTLISLLLGIDWALLAFSYIDFNNHELRIFLTITTIGLVTAAVGSLSVWMGSFIAFSLPQVISLLAVSVINNNVFIVIAASLFFWFMFLVAKNMNSKFKQGHLLIRENVKLIDKMDIEIENRKTAQLDLEKAQEVLEDVVALRTNELLATNQNLQEQVKKTSEVEEELQTRAYYDVLTGLPNRLLLIEKLKTTIVKAKRNGSVFGVLFIDIDRFKAINDSHGHDIGDLLIKQVAERITGVLRESDVVARNGGDEFVTIIEDMGDMREAAVVAEKVISRINQIFNVNGHEIHIGISVGISVYPSDSYDALDLLKMSDTAMHHAKDIASNNFEFYSSEMSNRIKERLELETALRTAVVNNELYMVYQPQVDLLNNKTTGFEALIRWNSPKFGRVSPAEFVPILEESGLIYAVGDWIIEEVIKFIKSGAARGVKVSINLSALQCSVNQYSEKIKRYIDDAKIDPRLIEFEVTETLLINDFNKTRDFLTRINQLGCTIALDDFGTGYTSFGYLAKLPIDVIKIDRSLIMNIDQETNLQNIVKAIITMCQSLGIDNVIEGVETENELNMIRQLNARTIQGYWYSKPLEVAEIDAWFEK